MLVTISARDQSSWCDIEERRKQKRDEKATSSGGAGKDPELKQRKKWELSRLPQKCRFPFRGDVLWDTRLVTAQAVGHAFGLFLVMMMMFITIIARD